MKKLKFYFVNPEYVSFLKEAEQTARGFSRVPDVEYSEHRKSKFLYGILLNINNHNYYAPVTLFTRQMPDNFLILNENEKPISSLRFNYMFPVLEETITYYDFSNHPDKAYRYLLSQEWKYCIENQDRILHLANRTYNRVLLGKNPGLVRNSCDFLLLEEKCLEYCKKNNIPHPALNQKAKKPIEIFAENFRNKQSILDPKTKDE